MYKFMMPMMLAALVAGCDSEPKRYPPTVVLGVVVDAETRQPLPNVGWMVFEVRNLVTLVMAQGKTDAEGRFRAEVSCCNAGRIEVNGYAGNNPNYEIHEVGYKLGITNELTFALPRAASR